jgi:hypothetical protein
MGFDITIGDEQTYLSYNWSMFSSYWYIRDDLSCKTGAEAAIRLRAALEKLKSENVQPVIIDQTFPNHAFCINSDGTGRSLVDSSWGWGNYKTAEGEQKDYDEHTLKCIFAFHLTTLLALAESNPDDTFEHD